MFAYRKMNRFLEILFILTYSIDLNIVRSPFYTKTPIGEHGFIFDE